MSITNPNKSKLMITHDRYARVVPEALTTVVDPIRFLPRGGSLLTSPLIITSSEGMYGSLSSVVTF